MDPNDVVKNAANLLAGKTKEEIVESHISYIGDNEIKISFEYENSKERKKIHSTIKELNKIFKKEKSDHLCDIKIIHITSENSKNKGVMIISMNSLYSCDQGKPISGDFKESIFDCIFYKLYF